jgi:hypothetical protein
MGVDMTLRRLAGRVTGSLAYSLGQARAEAVGRAFHAPTDRRHVFDATAHVRLLSSLDLQAAYTWASGAPYTRIIPTYLGNGQVPASILEDPFGRRSPAYSSLDLVLDWTARFDGWSLGIFVQGRNQLRHDNAVTYESTRLHCPFGIVSENLLCDDGSPAERADDFLDGIPLIPLLGFRVTF